MSALKEICIVIAAALVTTAATACGGAFTAKIPNEHDAEPDNDLPGLDALSGDEGEAGPGNDGGVSDEGVGDEKVTDAHEHDADVQDSAPDTLPPPTDTGCTMVAPTHVSWCISGGVDVPSQYCIESTSSGGYTGTSPAECQCVSTYTCACIEALNPCEGHGTFVSCTLSGPSGNIPLVQCT